MLTPHHSASPLSKHRPSPEDFWRWYEQREMEAYFQRLTDNGSSGRATRLWFENLDPQIITATGSALILFAVTGLLVLGIIKWSHRQNQQPDSSPVLGQRSRPTDLLAARRQRRTERARRRYKSETL